jgi:hypothetical protein
MSALRHVDIISNDPLAGQQRVLARLQMNGGPLELHVMSGSNTDEATMWSYLISRVRLNPTDDPIAFLEALPGAIDSTYVFASSVHSAAQCTLD